MRVQTEGTNREQRLIRIFTRQTLADGMFIQTPSPSGLGVCTSGNTHLLVTIAVVPFLKGVD